MTEGGSLRERRGVDRLINFSDAVVAVAVTLLALPLVDIAVPKGGESVWTLMGENVGQLWAFLFTFYVVIAMWGAHNRILNALAHHDVPIMWLNTTWLVLIVLLPWFSSLYGEAEVFAESGMRSSGVGLLYWGTLAVIGLIGSAMGWRLSSRPELCYEGEAPLRGSRQYLRGPVLGAYFLLIGVVSTIAPAVASWLPLGIVPLLMLMRGSARDESADR